MKLLYKPFAILLGLIAAFIARLLFGFLWGRFDDREPPRADHEFAPWPKIVGAAALEGATFAATRAAVERAGHKTFHHVTGMWPGERAPDPS